MSMPQSATFMEVYFICLPDFMASCSYWNFLAFCLYRLNKGELRPDHHVGFELASLYFHWVDFVWLLVFIIVYYWGSINKS
jgi:heme/copper-type cytochrome/quinol oxidase subunit 3